VKQSELIGPPVKDFAQGRHGPVGVWLVASRDKVSPAQRKIGSMCFKTGQSGLKYSSGPTVLGDTLFWAVKVEIRELRPWSDD